MTTSAIWEIMNSLLGFIIRRTQKYPRDNTLEEAVARMTAAAQAEGKDRLVRSVEEWKTLVLACMKANDFNRFSKDVVKRVGKLLSLDDLNRWLALAMNIWNSTPQPDRGDKSAYEIGHPGDDRAGA